MRAFFADPAAARSSALRRRAAASAAARRPRPPPLARGAPAPYVAIADGKADVEGGIIQVAARTAGVVRAVYVQEGDAVTKGQVLARQEDDAPRLAVADRRGRRWPRPRPQTALTDTQMARRPARGATG